MTATYTAGIQTATATASATTNLFQPAVDVTKSCSPDPVPVGQAELCTIVVTNTSSADSPELVNGTISDTLTGNLLDPANTGRRRQHLHGHAGSRCVVHDHHDPDGAGQPTPTRS